MQIFVASHPEAGIICAARTHTELADKLMFAFEYESWKMTDEGMEFLYEGNDITYTITELEV